MHTSYRDLYFSSDITNFTQDYLTSFDHSMLGIYIVLKRNLSELAILSKVIFVIFCRDYAILTASPAIYAIL
jgi:hypothetical protein